MSLCFVDPADAIRAIADSIGREARRQLLGEAVRAWVDEIPESELETHYAKAIAELDEHDLSMLAAWHGSLEIGQPVPNRDFLMGAFSSLGENRREALKLVVGFADTLPPPKQGAKAYEALIRLGIYASAFTPDDEYARQVAVIGRKNPAYRKQYQALIRKGLRAKDRQEMCRVRTLQASVTVRECELEEAQKGATTEQARKRCNAEFSLQQCLQKR